MALVNRPTVVKTLSETRDDVLIRITLAGDQAAFGELVRRYQDRLLTAMTAVCGSVSEAEDVIQEAFLQAYCKLDSFRSESRFYTWLYRIAFNMSVNMKRKKRPTLSVDHVRESTGWDAADSGPAPDDGLQRVERSEQLMAAIGRLAEEFRQVLVLRELEGFCYETISEVLDLPIGTVRSRLHRARQQLREDLQSWFAEN